VYDEIVDTIPGSHTRGPSQPGGALDQLVIRFNQP
jgi:hypothetical protein